ncbi:hypothetical protein Tco_0428189 [Tanacetum coccineum]
MGRDTIQLETAVSTISKEYLLEFTSKYGILEELHLELSGPEERIVDFLEGKVSVYTKFFEFANFRIPISQFLFDILGHYQIHLYGFVSKLVSAPNPTKVKTGIRPRGYLRERPVRTAFLAVVSQEVPTTKDTSECVSHPGIGSRKRDSRNGASGQQKAPQERSKCSGGECTSQDIKERSTSIRRAQDTRGGKSINSMGLVLGPEPPPVRLLYDTGIFLREASVTADPDSENTSFTSMAGSPGSIYQPGWGMTNGYRLDTPDACQDLAKLLKKSVAQVARRDQRIQARENEIKNLETLLEAEADMKKATEAKNAELVKELNIGVPELDIALCRIDQANVLTSMRSLANSKLVQALQDLKDLKYPMVDELERLKDAPMELIMASLHLESDTREDAPQWVRDLRPSSSQLKITIYPDVRDPKDLWAVKEEMLLEDAIAANTSWKEKKKKCRVVCHNHWVLGVQLTKPDRYGIAVSVLPTRLFLRG